jgi:hypothetical protein
MRPPGRSGREISDLSAPAREAATAWRPRYPAEWAELPGTAGIRYTAAEVARAMGLAPATVVAWIERGWLKAARQRDGVYRIRHRAIRRALRDHPQVAATAMRAWHRWTDARSPAAPEADDEAGPTSAAHGTDGEPEPGEGSGLT